MKLRGLEEAAAGDKAVADALAARDAHDESHVLPARTTAQQAEKEAHDLSRDIAQLKERLDGANYITAREQGIKAAKTKMETAQEARDTAVTAHEARAVCPGRPHVPDEVLRGRVRSLPTARTQHRNILSGLIHEYRNAA
ncbi:hypothetical protein [Streptomyces sp. NPDC051662]|uniref:hypothetical protein n=1 Tax=Streptomyces sp. NPDC051662 TaxID=3154750 RepID=UPI003424687A